MQLYVDDMRKAPSSDWVVAHTYAEAINRLRTCNVTTMSLDHDLGARMTGYDICLWMSDPVHQDMFEWPTVIILHTSNTVGRDNMRQLLAHYKPHTTAIVG
jgi:hypothetical protein